MNLKQQCIHDLVIHYPQEQEHEYATIFLDKYGKRTSLYTYRELKQQCLVSAQQLQAKVPKGEVLLLSVEDPAQFVVGFISCLMVGVVPAPIQAFRHANDKESVSRIRAIVQSGVATKVMISESQLSLFEAYFADLPVTAITVESLNQSSGLALRLNGAADLPTIAPDSIAYIQYTSGSTSHPKGACLSHAQVMNNLAHMCQTFKREEKARVVGWLPFHHDMGLVGQLFTALYEGGLGVFLAPSSFLSDPKVWFDAINKYRGNIAAVPAFAIADSIRKVTPKNEWDLSCLKYLYVGSETVNLKPLMDFVSLFGSVGISTQHIYPVYGLAEATLLAAGGDKPLAELLQNFVDKPIGNQTRRLTPYPLGNAKNSISITDHDTRQPLADGKEGEITIAAPYIFSGYYDTQKGQFPNGMDALHTGDMGYIDGDFLYITGRCKEIIIVRGVNYHAEDLECCAKFDNPYLRSQDRTASVSYLNNEQEQLLVFQEIQRHTPSDKYPVIVEKLQANLLAGFGIKADVIHLIPAGLMPKTRNHKISRNQCLEKYQSGHLKTLFTSEPELSHPQETADSHDPIVVVGMACRFPGGANNIEQFWDMLCEGKDGITKVPSSRWDNSIFFDRQVAVPGKMNTKWSGFVDDIDQFDASLFAISPYEAPEIDPQQRMLLETSWRLLENTGWKKEDIKHSDTGVFVGISNNDYLYLKIKLSENLESFNAYSGLGNANSIAANRLSYFYDLKGPSLAVDTACSSSLTAFNYAIKAIENGECTQAIAGGVNAIISPGTTVTLSQFGMMSPKGRCKTFDASADGYVRAEGCGLVMLKRQSAAIRDGDHIMAVVQGSIAAQDGQSAGMTFPNGKSQRRLLTKTLQQAGLSGSTINYIEAHGTGTPSGDPVEVEQLAAVYGKPTDVMNAQKCYVGSVKANVGHLESAAGIAGLIKVILMLNRHRVPPQLHVAKLNPRIHLENTRLAVPLETSPWEASNRTAAISSFGFGGSLAHAILSEPKTTNALNIAQQISPLGNLPQRMLVLSHHSLKGLTQQASNWLPFLQDPGGATLDDITYTQATCRSHLKYRKAFIANDITGLSTQLDNFCKVASVARPASEETNKLGFLFTGQGTRYTGMASELYQNISVFRDAFDRCAAATEDLDLPMPFAQLAFSVDEDSAAHQHYHQAILFSIQYALGIFWQVTGAVPQVLLGHSLGEYAAACLAGCFEPETGVKILLARSALLETLNEKGAMLSVSAHHSDVEAVLNPSLAQVAVINSPDRTVVAGTRDELDRISTHFNTRGIDVQPLKVPVAFHSHLLDPIVEKFRSFLSQFEFHPPVKPWISSTSAKQISGKPDAEHWVRHLRDTVQFSEAAQTLSALKVSHCIEIGPGASTLFAVRESLPGSQLSLLRSFAKAKDNKPEASHLFDTLGKLYEDGWSIQWQSLMAGHKIPQQVPGLKFQHKRYWLKGLEPHNIAAFAGPIYGVNTAVTASEAINDETDQSKGSEPEHYDLVWTQRQSIPTLDAIADLRENTSWLLVGSDSPLLQSIKRQIKARGHQVYWVSTDKQDHSKFDIQITATDDPTSAFDKLNKVITGQSRANTEAWKLLYLPDEDDISSQRLQINHLKDNLSNKLGTFITFLKALRHVVITPPVWVVTKMSQQVTPEEAQHVSLLSVPLWGFAKTLFLEHPEWRGGMIDIDAKTSSDQSATDIMAKVLSPGTEHCVAFRQNHEFAEQLLLAPPPAQTPVKFRQDGAFVITGGLGGLGLKSAKWVIEKGAKHLILMSRKTLPPQNSWANITADHEHFAIVQALMALQKKDVKIEIASQDVRDLAQLESLFTTLKNNNTPVRGILHAAGVNWFSKIMDLKQDAFFDTLETKIAATWKLHQLSQTLNLDCFILYSSVSALWGSVNLSHYTAANFFLDAMSLYRKGLGLTSTCVDWGPWADVGMSAKPEEQALLTKMGFTLMTPEEALAAMERELACNRPLSLIGKIDWKKYQSFIDFTLQPSLFEHVIVKGSAGTAEDAPDHLEDILKADPDEARNLIKQVVNMELRSVMLIESMEEIPGDKRFNFLGMDSLMAILLATKLEQYFNVKLPNTLAYNYPHINAVTEHLFERVYLLAHPQAGTQEAPDNSSISTRQATPENLEAPEPDLPPQPAALVKPQHGDWLNTFKPITAQTQLILYCFPYTGSGPLVYQPWADKLDDSIALIGIQPPGKDERSNEKPLTSMTEAITDFMAHFESPDLPFAFYGHSLGAHMAYESYAALINSRQPLPFSLVLSGCNAPAIRKTKEVYKLPDDQFVDAVLEKYEGIGQNSVRRIVLERNIGMLRADIETLETYQPADTKVACPLNIIAGRADPILSAEKVRNWVNFSDGDFGITYILGGHGMVSEQQDILINMLSDMLSQQLEAVDKNSEDTTLATVIPVATEFTTGKEEANGK